jgi:hypothetical protein
MKMFQMMEESKSLATPMIPNMRLSTYSNLNLVDPSLYRELISSFVSLVNTSMIFVL